MILGEVDLQGGVAGIFGVGETLHHVLQRHQGALRLGLVAADIHDLLIERDRLEIEGIGDFLAAGMQRDILVGGGDRVVIFVGLVGAEGAHQLGPAGPDRIGMLAVHFVELGGGLSQLPLLIWIQAAA